jgi:hypothetical protein
MQRIFQGRVRRKERAQPSESQRRRALSEAGLEFDGVRGLKSRNVTRHCDESFLVRAATRNVPIAGCRSDAETTNVPALWNNKAFLHFGTTKTFHGRKIDSRCLDFCTPTKNSRFHSEGPCRRRSVLCHDVAVRGSSRGSSNESLDGNLSPVFPPQSEGTTTFAKINSRRPSNHFFSGSRLTFLGRTRGDHP